MRHLPKLLAPLALALVLAACAGGADVRAVSSLAIACDSYATALDQVTPLRRDGKLSVDQVSRISAANEIAAKACDPGSSFDPAQALGMVKAVTDQIKTVISGGQ